MAEVQTVGTGNSWVDRLNKMGLKTLKEEKSFVTRIETKTAYNQTGSLK